MLFSSHPSPLWNSRSLIPRILIFVAVSLLMDGLQLEPLVKNLLREKAIIQKESRHIFEIYPDSPAAAADVAVNDEVIALNDRPAGNDFYTAMNERPFSETTLTLRRDGSEFTVTFPEREYTNEYGGRLGIIDADFVRKDASFFEIVHNHFAYLFDTGEPNSVFKKERERRAVWRGITIVLAASFGAVGLILLRRTREDRGDGDDSMRIQKLR